MANIERKQVPNYPDYHVQSDGRVYKYTTIKGHTIGNPVGMTPEGKVTLHAGTTSLTISVQALLDMCFPESKVLLELEPDLDMPEADPELEALEAELALLDEPEDPEAE